MRRRCFACDGEGSLAGIGGPAGDCDFCEGEGYVTQRIIGDNNVQVGGSVEVRGVECDGPIVVRNGGSQVVSGSKIGGSIVQTRGDGFEVEVLPTGVYINGVKYGDGVHVVCGRVIRVRGRNVQAQGMFMPPYQRRLEQEPGKVTPIKPDLPRSVNALIMLALAAIVMFAWCQAFG